MLPNATTYNGDAQIVNFTTKIEEFEQAQFEQVRQYINIANRQLMGARVQC